VCIAVIRDKKEEHQEVYAMTHKSLEENYWTPRSEISIVGAVKYIKYDYFEYSS